MGAAVAAAGVVCGLMTMVDVASLSLEEKNGDAPAKKGKKKQKRLQKI